jgi:hypothetical protein
MKFRISYVCLLFILLRPHFSFSQTQDFAIWPNIYLQESLTKRLNVHINQQTRFNENVSQLGYIYADMGFGYRLNKFMLVNLDYVIARKRNADNFFSTRHQYYVSLVMKKEFRRYRPTYRMMFQEQNHDVYSSANGRILQSYFRNKLTLRYELNKYLTPYIATELYYHFNTRSADNSFSRLRYFVGIFYHLRKNSDLELYYLIQQGLNEVNPQRDYVIGIGFSNNIDWIR